MTSVSGRFQQRLPPYLDKSHHHFWIGFLSGFKPYLDPT